MSLVKHLCGSRSLLLTIMASIADVPKKRRISTSKAQKALALLSENVVKQQHEAEIAAIIVQLRDQPHKIVQVKAFLASGMSLEGDGDRLPRCVSKLSDVPHKHVLRALSLVTGKEMHEFVNYNGPKKDLTYLFWYASGQPSSWILPEKRMPVEKFMELYMECYSASGKLLNDVNWASMG